MRRPGATILLSLSLALNVAFAGTWVAHAFAAGRPGTHDPAPRPDDRCPLYARLGLSEQQWRTIEPRWAEFRAASDARCAEIKRLHGELYDRLAAAPPDRAAVGALLDRISAGQRAMQDLVVAYLIDQGGTLSAEQRAEMIGVLRRRSGCPGHGGHPTDCPEKMGGCDEDGRRPDGK